MNLEPLEARDLLAVDVMNDVYQVREDTVLVISAADGIFKNDLGVDFNSITAILQTAPADGQLVLAANGSFSYTPKPGFTGQDSFTYKAFDGVDESVTAATVTIAIAPTFDLGGNVFEDLDPDAPFEGIAIELRGAGGGLIDQTSTDSAGNYGFTVVAGEYAVSAAAENFVYGAALFDREVTSGAVSQQVNVATADVMDVDFGFAFVAAGPASTTRWIDFETDATGASIAAGEVIDDEWAPWGVTVSTFVRVPESDGAGGYLAHPPLVFDSASPTTGHEHLGTPNENASGGGPGEGAGGEPGGNGPNESPLDKILIVSADDSAASPAPLDREGQVIFTFDEPVTLDEVRLLDIEQAPASPVLWGVENFSDTLFTLSDYTDPAGGFTPFGELVANEWTGIGGITAMAIDRDGVAYMISNEWDGVQNLYKLDLTTLTPQTGSGELLVPELVGAIYGSGAPTTTNGKTDVVTGLAFHPGTGDLYALVEREQYQFPAVVDDLLILDKGTAEVAQRVGLLQEFDGQTVVEEVVWGEDLEFVTDASGNVHLYVTDNKAKPHGDPDATKQIFEVDPDTAEIIGIFDGALEDGLADGLSPDDDVEIRALAWDPVSERIVSADDVHDAVGEITSGSGGNIRYPSSSTTDPGDFALSNHFTNPRVEGVGFLPFGRPGTIDLFDAAGDLISTIPISGLGANSFQVVDIDTPGVSELRVNLASGGAVTDVVFSTAGEDPPVTLVEEDFLVVEHREDFTVPAGAAAIELDYSALVFDSTDPAGMNDAFEIALVDQNERPLVGTIGQGKDAFFNFSEGEAVVLGGGAAHDAQSTRVTLDILHLPPGTKGTLIWRLVNNDNGDDDETTVTIDPRVTVLETSPIAGPTTTTPLVAGSVRQSIDFARLSDVSASMTLDYEVTSFDERRDRLYAGATLTNSGTFDVGGPILVGVRNLSDPLVRLANPDGFAADGTAFYNVTHLALDDPADRFASGESFPFELIIADPEHRQFTFELVVLAHLNDAPAFFTEPVREVVAGRNYRYDSEAADADEDTLAYSLVSGPAGLAVNAVTGELTWTTTAGDAGSHPVIIRTEDPDGARDEQAYLLSVTTGVPNRPPIFTSVPVVDAYVGTPYEYPATAFDIDGDPLDFDVDVSSPGGMTILDTIDDVQIPEGEGRTSWTPPAELAGQLVPVTLIVDDGQGGTAEQTFDIYVHPQVGNHPPLIVSDPQTIFLLPDLDTNPPTGNVSPQSLQEFLSPGELVTRTLSLTLPTGSSDQSADILLVVDESGSMGGEHAWIGEMILDLSAALEAQGITDNRFALMGFVDELNDIYSVTPETVTVSVFSPDGELVWLDDVLYRDGEVVLPDDIELAGEGQYTVTVRADTPGEEPFNFAFGVESVVDPAVTLTGLGEHTMIIDDLNPQPLQFDAPQGAWLYVDGLEAAGGFAAIEDPADGYFSSSPNGKVELGPFAVTRGGTHLLHISAPTVSTYDYRLLDVSQAATSLTLNQPVGPTSIDPYQTHLYTFSGAMGEDFFFDARNDGSLTGYVRLVAPSGEEVIAWSDVRQDQGPVRLPQTGEYLLMIRNESAAVESYDFALFELSTAGTDITPPAGQAAAIGDSLDTPHAADVYRFDAAAGERMFFDQQSWSGASGARWMLVGPHGDVVFDELITSDVNTLELPASGEYKLFVRGHYVDGAGDESYDLVIQPEAVTNHSLTLGTSYSETLDTAGELHRYEFTLADPGLLYFDSQTSDGDIRWSLAGPAGTLVDARAMDVSDGDDLWQGEPVNFAWPGDYVLTVEGAGDATGAFAVAIFDLAQAQTSISFGTAVSDTLDPASQTHVYQFAADAGEDFAFETNSVSTYGQWQLVDPVGRIVSTRYLEYDLPDLSDAVSGVYTLVIEGDVADTGTYDYGFTVERLSDETPGSSPTPTLTLGTAVSATHGGGETEYNFTLDAPGLLVFDSQSPQWNLFWRLEGPGGELIADREFLYSDSGYLQDPYVVQYAWPGDYTLTVSGAYSGDYEFVLWDLTDSALIPDLTLGAVESVTLDPASTTVLYQFDAAQGDEFYIDVPASDATSSKWRLVDAFGAVAASGDMQTDRDGFVAATSGTYTLLIEGAIDESGTLNYDAAVYHVHDAPQVLTLGASIDADLDQPGDRDVYTFSGSPGDVVYYDAFTASGPTVELVSPSGSVIHSAAAWIKAGPFRLLESGEYRLVFDATGAAMGPYNFRLLDAAAQPLVIDGLHMGQIDPPEGSDVFYVNASRGDRLRLVRQAWGDADTMASAAGLLSIRGIGLEDSYAAITRALERLEFRAGAAKSVVLISDEDRDISDIVPPGAITYNTTLARLSDEDAVLHVIVNAALEGAQSAGGQPLTALGIEGDERAFLADGAGSYTEGVEPAVVSAFGSSESDYIDLADALGGGAWDLNQLRAGGDVAESFSEGFVSFLENDIAEQLAVALVPSDPAANFVTLTPAQVGGAGVPLDFDVEITGDGNPYSFDALFVRENNPAVVLGSIPVTITTEYVYDVDAIDPDDDPIAMSLLGETHGAAFDPDTGLLNWGPPGPGEYTFTALVTDGRGGEDRQTWTVTVGVESSPTADPVFEAISTINAVVGRAISISVHAIDPDPEDRVRYQLVGAAALDPAKTLDAITGVFEWQPTEAGTFEIDVRAVDGRGGQDSATFTIEVAEPDLAGFTNARPDILSTPIAVVPLGEVYRYQVEAIDIDGDPVRFDLSVAPEGLVVDPIGGAIVWRPAREDIGTHSVILRARDGQGGVALQAFDVAVTNFNDPPQITSPPPDVVPSGADGWTYPVTAVDPNGDDVSFYLYEFGHLFETGGYSSGLTIDPVTGELALSEAVDGSWMIRVYAEDGRGARGEQTFELRVGGNSRPQFDSVPDTTVLVGDTFSYPVEVSDPNAGDVVTVALDAASLDRGMSLDLAGGDYTLTWQPHRPGSYPVVLTADDGQGGISRQGFTLDVVPAVVASRPPEFTSVPSGPAYVSQLWNYQVAAVDPDWDAFTFALIDPPAGMMLDQSNLVTWQPTAATSGQQVTIEATDVHGAVSTQSFLLPVVEVPPENEPPRFDSLPIGPAVVGQLWQYSLAASDPNGDLIGFELVNPPGDMDFAEPGGSLIDWVPDTAGTYPVEITADDGRGGMATQEFDLVVVDPSQGFAISSVPTGPAYAGTEWQYDVALSPTVTGPLYSLDAASVARGLAVDAVGQITWTPAAGDVGLHTVALVVTDGASGVAVQEFALEVKDTAGGLTITSVPTVVVPFGQTWQYALTASDPAATFSLDELSVEHPAGMAFDTQSPELLTWQANRLGEHNVVIVADDTVEQATQSFVLRVVPTPAANLAPEIGSSPQGPATVDRIWRYQVDAIDINGDSLRYGLDAASIGRGMSVDTAGLVTWTADAAGDYAVTLHVSDGRGGVATQSFTLPAVEAAPLGLPPVIRSQPPQPAVEEVEYQYQVDAIDPEGAALEYYLDNGPAGMSIGLSTGLLIWTPELGDAAGGPYAVTIRVDDQSDGVTLQTFQLDVVAAPSGDAPAILSTPTEHAYNGEPWQYQVVAVDPNDDPLTYSLRQPPLDPPITIDAETGLVAWTPTAAQVGSHTFTVTVSDPAGNMAEQRITLPVESGPPSNAVPVITSQPATTTTVGQVYQYPIAAYDPEGQPLTYNIVSGPGGAAIDSAGRFTWQPQLTGSFPITLGVSDGVNAPTTQSFTLNVAPPQSTNRPPQFISTPPGPAAVDREYRYRPQVTDPDGHSVTLSLAGGPAGMQFDAGDPGLLVWTPDASGAVQVSIQADDGQGALVTQTFWLGVVGNLPPVIAVPPPQTADVNDTYALPLDVTDPNPEDVEFTFALDPVSIQRGMAIDTAGEISWTTPAVPGTFAVTATATDSRGASSSRSFDLRVVDPATNSPPSIGVNPRSTIPLGQVFLHQFSASDPDGDPVAFALDAPAPAGMALDPSGLLTWTTTESQVGQHNYTVILDDGVNAPVEIAYTIDVLHQLENSPPQITSAPPEAAVARFRYVYDAAATDPDGDTLFWSLVSGPAGMTVDDLSGRVTWTPPSEEVGEHEVLLRVSDFYGAADTQSFTLTVRGANLPPMIDSFPLTQIADTETFVYEPVARDPDGDEFHFSLATDPTPPAGMTIDPATGRIEYTPTGPGSFTAGLVVRDAFGYGVQQNFTVSIVDTNLPPEFDSTPPWYAVRGESYDYTLHATDPNGDTLTYNVVWPGTQPSGVSFNSSTGVLQWDVDPAETTGPLLVEFTASDVTLTTSQFININILDNTAPVLTLADQTIEVGRPFAYDVQATDADGNPLTYSLSGQPAGMTIDPGMGRITWTDTSEGSHTGIAVTVSDPFGGADTQTFDLTVTADATPPLVEILLTTPDLFGYQQTEVDAPFGGQITILVTAADNVAVTSLELIVNNQNIALAADGTAQITAGQTAETWAITGTARDAAGNLAIAGADIHIIDPTDTASPVAVLNSPDAGTTITAPTDITATITDPDTPAADISYILQIESLDGSLRREIARGMGAGSADQVLGRLDPTMLENGTYRLLLTATDPGGNVSTTSRDVNVAGDLKLGNFALTFVDLEIPVAGFPIVVSRSYDTLAANRDGELGFGWRLDVSDTDLRVDFPAGTLPGLGRYKPFRDGTRVTITLPGGETESFTFRPRPAQTLFSLVFDFQPAFEPEPGGTSTLSVPAVSLRKFGDEYIAEGTSYNPADPLFGRTYTLETQDKIRYTIDAVTGDVISIANRAGVSLTFPGDGIESSTGARVDFERDQLGRITALIDPLGNRVEYGYDSRGDLVSVADRLGNITQLVYRDEPAHYLEEIIDPLGRTGQRVEYGDDGRVSAMIDTLGQSIGFAYDPSGRTRTITDPLGSTQLQRFDERGNLVFVQDPLGATIERVYDENGNLLSETNPLGDTTAYAYQNGQLAAITDPLGGVTQLSYNEYGELTALTNAVGMSTTLRYDEDGNIQRTTDPQGRTTVFSYDADGNVTSETTSRGTKTYAYDAFGYLAEDTNELGHTVNYTYDPNGNPLSISRTLTTPSGPEIISSEITYDAAGHVLTETDFEGYTRSNEYDAAGNLTATTDELGRTTRYDYDVRGLPIQIMFDDGLAVALDYDLFGRLLSETSAAGLVTHFRHDAVGRRIETIWPDATPHDLSDNPRSQIEFDAAGQTTAIVDELGRRREIEYDAAGRVVVRRDPAGGELVTDYDPAGRALAAADELGRVTRYVYNADSSQPSSVLLPDGTTLATTYDFLGNPASFTDQEGRTTLYETDALGRLTAVVDALEGRTEYEYNEHGNLTRQTDANGRITDYEYDALGQLTAIVRPMGERFESQYDAAGNVSRSIDFDGTVIDYEYNEQAQLIEKQFADGSSVVLTYTAGGDVQSIVDGRGTTTFDYDERRRLTSRTDPDGRQISYTYDAVGNRTSVTVPSGTTSYTFDELNRLATVTDPAGRLTSYSYDAAGNVVLTNLPGGITELREYDALNRVILVENSAASGLLSRYEYARRPSGHIESVTELDGRTVDYQYDELYRLIGESISDPVSGDRDITYDYDPVGNRTQKVDTAEGTTDYLYDANDRLDSETLTTLAEDVVVRNYEYDDNGNLLVVSEDGVDQVVYEWDDENRLASADTKADGTPDVEYIYDAEGIRVGEISGGEETRYLVDKNLPYAQVLEEYTPGGIIKVSYIFGTKPISQHTDAGEDHVFLFDGHSGVRGLADLSGNVDGTFDYDAFGRLIDSSGIATSVLGYQGERFDAATGQIYLRARYLDPATGRFLSADPFQGRARDPLSRHRYIYGHDDPVNSLDPSGQETLISLMSSMRSRLQARWSQAKAAFKVLKGKKKIGIIYLASTSGSFERSPSPLQFGHWYIFARLRSPAEAGLAYEMGPGEDELIELEIGPKWKFVWDVVKGVKGSLTITPTAWSVVKRRNIVNIAGRKVRRPPQRVVAHSLGQFAAWNVALRIETALVGAAIDGIAGEVAKRYAFNPITGTNCYQWTAQAAATAILAGRLPI